MWILLTALSRNSQNFMGCQDLLLWSQEPTTCSYFELDESSSDTAIKIHFNITLPSLSRHWSDTFPSGFPTMTLYHPSHLKHFGLYFLKIFGREYKLWSSSYRLCQPLFPSPSYVQIISIVLYNRLYLQSQLRVLLMLSFSILQHVSAHFGPSSGNHNILVILSQESHRYFNGSIVPNLTHGKYVIFLQ
jgi:hypothetical protein